MGAIIRVNRPERGEHERRRSKTRFGENYPERYMQYCDLAGKLWLLQCLLIKLPISVPTRLFIMMIILFIKLFFYLFSYLISIWAVIIEWRACAISRPVIKTVINFSHRSHIYACAYMCDQKKVSLEANIISTFDGGFSKSKSYPRPARLFFLAIYAIMVLCARENWAKRLWMRGR